MLLLNKRLSVSDCHHHYQFISKLHTTPSSVILILSLYLFSLFIITSQTPFVVFRRAA